MTTYYVSTNGSDNANGSAKSPWRTINKAMKANLKSGDEVVVRSGTYKEGVVVTKDGITLRSEVPGGAKIDAPTNKLGININADHVTVKGFEVFGSTTAGIVGNGVHHVEVLDNTVHDNKGIGILLMKSDFITVDGNVVYNNASLGAKSGISIFHPKAISSDSSGYRIIIRNNVSHHNQNETGAHTDGAGIILDDFNATQDPKLPPYKFPVLVEKNLVYQNGGAGIMVYKTSNAMIRGNTSWQNQMDNHPSRGTWRTELQTQASDHITWVGNIAIANPNTNKHNASIGSFSFKGEKNVGVEWRDNITFNGKSGDDAVSTNNGNPGPSAKENKLGVNPGLDFSDIKALATKVGNLPFSPAATAAVDALALETDTAAAEKAASDVVQDGTSGADKLFGTSGADKLEGGAGADKLFGAAGDDQLFGGAGRDKLFGGAGNDLLQGGLGKDVLVGGAGADDFVFASAAEAGKVGQRDVIRDFSGAQGDDIDLSGIDANAKALGNQAFSFIGNETFSGKAGQLRYEDGIVAGDVNGDKVADFHIEIANKHALSAGDFLL
jgi:serralysin